MTTMTVTKYYQEIQMDWKINIFRPGEDGKYKCFVCHPFSFADTTWRMLLVGDIPSNPKSAKITLQCSEFCKQPVEYILSLKRVDDNEELIHQGFMLNRHKHCEHPFMKLSKAIKQRAIFAPSEAITITCLLRTAAPDYKESSMLIKPKRKKFKKLDTLSQNFSDLYTKQSNWDTILLVKDREYKAHKIVLVAHSKVFAAMFQHDTVEKQTGVITIPDCDPIFFEKFLKFLYCGQLDDITSTIAINLYVISEKYNVEELKQMCTSYLIANLHLANFCDVVIIADLYSDESFMYAAQAYFHENLFSIFHTSDWEFLMRDNYQLACKLLRGIPSHILKSDE